jgi:hypothetical protein
MSLRWVGGCYNGLGKRKKRILSHILVEPRVKNEVLGFNGRDEKTMNNKITFVKEKDMA